MKLSRVVPGADLIYAKAGNDSYIGGGGIDTLSYANATSGITLHLDSSTAIATAGTDSFSGFTRYVGSNYGDTIYGSTGNDTIQGGTGNDLFYVSLGSDTLDGGARYQHDQFCQCNKCFNNNFEWHYYRLCDRYN